MFKSFRQRLSQSGGSRPSVIDDASGRSRDNSVELGDGAESSLGGGLDSIEGDSDDPFDASLDRRASNNWRSSSAERQKVRRLHSASSAVTVDRIDPAAVTSVTGSGQPLGLKQRAKNFLFRRRSLTSLDTHKIDGRPARIDPKLVSSYAAKRHRSDDCVLDAGDREAENVCDIRGDSTREGGNEKNKSNFSRSLNIFTSMRHRSRSRDTGPKRGGASTGGGSSDGGWTDASAGTGLDDSSGAGGDGQGHVSTLNRRGHKNSEQYMAPPPIQQRQSRQQANQVYHSPYLHQQQRQLSSADVLATNLNELSGLCLERTQLRTRIDELLSNWPAVPLEATSAWFVGSSGGGSKNKRLSMAFKKASFFPAFPSLSTGSSASSGPSTSGVYTSAGSNLTSVSHFSGSTAEQLNLLCRQFNQAVTLRKSYRGKDSLSTRIQRRSSGHWSGSSGSSSRTTESKSFTKQAPNSTTASKDSALEMKFEDTQQSKQRQSAAQVPSSSSESYAPQHQHQHQHQNQQQHQHKHLHQHQVQYQHQHPAQYQEHPSKYHLQNQQHHQSTSPQSPTAFRFPSPELSLQQSATSHQNGQQQANYSHQSDPNGRLTVHGYENIQPSLTILVQTSNTEEGIDAPLPPRRSTSLRQSTESIATLPVPSGPSEPTQASPTYLNHMVLSGIPTVLPFTTSPQSTTPAAMASASTVKRLDQISESPDDEAAAAAAAAASVSPPQSPPLPLASVPLKIPARAALRLPYSRPVRPVSMSGDGQHPHLIQQQMSLPENTSTSYQQWRGALPYATQSSFSSSSSLASVPTSANTLASVSAISTIATATAPPRQRQPLLPTGDSARIVREARAKLSQLNRLSAELAKRQQLPAPPPAVCPFDALSMATPARPLTSGPATVEEAAVASYRNSLLLQDELAVREYLKDLTSVCSTDY